MDVEIQVVMTERVIPECIVRTQGMERDVAAVLRDSLEMAHETVVDVYQAAAKVTATPASSASISLTAHDADPAHLVSPATEQDKAAAP